MSSVNEKLAGIGYDLRGFIRRDEQSIVVMGERQDHVDPMGDRQFATWEYGETGLYWGHYDLDFEQARDDMASRAGYVRGEQGVIDGIRVQTMRTDDGARIRPNRRG